MGESRKRRIENLRQRLRKVDLRIALTKDDAERARLREEACNVAGKIAALAGAGG